MLEKFWEITQKTAEFLCSAKSVKNITPKIADPIQGSSLTVGYGWDQLVSQPQLMPPWQALNLRNLT